MTLAASAPVIWAVADLWFTGDPLHSLHGTQALAGELDRPRSLPTALELTPEYLRESLGPTIALVAVAGVALGLRRRRRESTFPLVLIALGLATFFALGVAGLPLLERYLLLPTVMLALFAALAMFGWTALPRGTRQRRAWLAGGALAVGLVALQGAHDVRELRWVRVVLEERQVVRHDLEETVRDPAVAEAAGRCDIVASDRYHVPFVALALERQPASVVVSPAPAGTRALVLGYPPARNPATGARRLHQGERWSADALGC